MCVCRGYDPAVEWCDHIVQHPRKTTSGVILSATRKPRTWYVDSRALIEPQRATFTVAYVRAQSYLSLAVVGDQSLGLQIFNQAEQAFDTV